MRWTVSDVSFQLVPEDTSGSVATVEFVTPKGVVVIMGEPRQEGRVLIVGGVHISSRDIMPNDVGLVNLRTIAQAVMTEMDYDGIVVEGEVRTTGANKGHRPRPIRFARSPGSDTGR
jgi:hypothetical protein